MLDADAHVMETEDWLDPFTERALLGRVRATLGRSFSALHNTEIAKAKAAHADHDYRSRCATDVMLRKNYWATGSFLREDRALALDAIGVRRQLVSNTLLGCIGGVRRAVGRRTFVRLCSRHQPCKSVFVLLTSACFRLDTFHSRIASVQFRPPSRQLSWAARPC